MSSLEIIRTGRELLEETAGETLPSKVVTAIAREPAMAVEVLLAAVERTCSDGPPAKLQARILTLITDVAGQYDEHVVNCTQGKCQICKRPCRRAAA